MRTVLALIALTMTAAAQDSAALADAQNACGPKSVIFDVHRDHSQHAVMQPEAGKALIYVIHDEGGACAGWGCATLKIGLDGAWMGANRHNSYFSFAVEPGERHICAMWQSRLARASQPVGLAHFTAEAGKVYYFRTRLLVTNQLTQTFLDLDPIDSDQGKFFVASYPLSISHPRN